MPPDSGDSAGNRARNDFDTIRRQTVTAFADLDLNRHILKAISTVGFEEPTPIQLEAIPIMLSGRDLIAQAQTGTGKTAAFALPIIQRLKTDAKLPQALVLAPTRELAVQVAETFHQLGRTRNIRSLAVYGGQPIERQLRALRYPVDVVVGTPGRLMDHIRRETLDLRQVRTVVLDEADEMLDMGFIEDIEWILERVPAERQTALFSATMPSRIIALARRHLNDPERVAIQPEHVTVELTRQAYYEVTPRAKLDTLTRILDIENPNSAIIFCRTKREVDELTQKLQSLGYPAEALHGDLSQTQRDRVMARFRRNQAELLVATDVAARGIDVENISHVFNYDIPNDPESYVHRIGRTGRAGRAGTAITLVTPRERRHLRAIEYATSQRMERRPIPTREEVASRHREVLATEIIKTIDEDGWERALPVVDDLMDEFPPERIAAAALTLLMKERGMTEPSQPVPVAMGGIEPGMDRLLIDLGRNDGIRPNDVVGAIANEARIPGKRIGQIEILDDNTFVDVPTDTTERVLRAMSETRLRGRPATIQRAPAKTS
jgi:ATP-dependent RNA helicase DeaD